MSIIGYKPKLKKNLESKFDFNQSSKLALKGRTKNAIEYFQVSSPGTMNNLVASLSEKKFIQRVGKSRPGDCMESHSWTMRAKLCIAEVIWGRDTAVVKR